MKKNILLSLAAFAVASLSFTTFAASFYCETDGVVNNKKAVTQCLYLEVASSLLADKYCLQWGKHLNLVSNRDPSELVMSTTFVKNNSQSPNPRSAKQKCEEDRARIIEGNDADPDMTKNEVQLGRYMTTIYTRGN